jgi:AcrR family transcriptional regulator
MTQLAGRPLRADARRNRERVLIAARAAFAEQGHDAQMDDVARRAMVGVGTIYRHFPTKEALIEALALESFERLAAAGRLALAVDDPWEALVQLLWAGAEIMAGDRALSEIVAEIPGPIELPQELGQELSDTTTELIRRAHEAGVLREGVIFEDVPMLMCGVAAATCKSHIYPDAWRRHVAIVIDGLRATSASGQLPH